jgi:hypothetical protein
VEKRSVKWPLFGRAEERTDLVFELYKDEKGETRWRLLANNNKILCASGEGFTRPSKAIANIEKVRALAPHAGIVERKQ